MREGIYLVTDRALCGTRGVVETVRLAVDGGVTTVQLRDKDAGLEDHLRQLESLAEVIDGRACLIVNDRLDAVQEALRLGIPVDGLHVGQGDLSPAVARAELGPDVVIGLSAQTPEHFAAIEPGTVDYVGVGAIHATATKADAPEPLGVEGFRELVSPLEIPACAIGGVKAPDVAPLRRAGAASVAVVSAICAADDPEQAARELVRVWDGAYLA